MKAGQRKDTLKEICFLGKRGGGLPLPNFWFLSFTKETSLKLINFVWSLVIMIINITIIIMIIISTIIIIIVTWFRGWRPYLRCIAISNKFWAYNKYLYHHPFLKPLKDFNSQCVVKAFSPFIKTTWSPIASSEGVKGLKEKVNIEAELLTFSWEALTYFIFHLKANFPFVQFFIFFPFLLSKQCPFIILKVFSTRLESFVPFHLDGLKENLKS